MTNGCRDAGDYASAELAAHADNVRRAMRSYIRTIEATRAKMRDAKVELGLALKPVWEYFLERSNTNHAAESRFHAFIGGLGVHKARARACLAAAEWHQNGRQGPLQRAGAMRGRAGQLLTSHDHCVAENDVASVLQFATRFDGQVVAGEGLTENGPTGDGIAYDDGDGDEWDEPIDPDIEDGTAPEYAGIACAPGPLDAVTPVAVSAKEVGVSGAQMGFESIYQQLETAYDEIAAIMLDVAVSRNTSPEVAALAAEIERAVAKFKGLTKRGVPGSHRP